MKKIIFNGLHYEQSGAGISKYTQKLLETFLKGNYDLDIMMRQEFEESYHDERIIFAKNSIESSTQRIIEEQIESKRIYKNHELVHFPDYATPILYKGNKVATIHDMAMHTMRDKYTLTQNLTKNILLKQTIKKADRLICVSEFSRKELLQYYPEVSDKSAVVYEGVEEPKFHMKERELQQTLYNLGIRNKFILYVGTIAPHKNIDRLIRAFANLKKEGYTHKLVIAGKKGWMYEQVFREVTDLQLQNEVIFTGFIAEDELEVLYRKAELFISISLYEGFGFPPLEAMVRECPVLVSNIEIFQETCSDKVVYCNPKDIDDITRSIKGVLDNKVLAEKLRREGILRSQLFTWNNTAKETYNVYREILNK